MKTNRKKNIGQVNSTMKAYLSNIDSEKKLNATEMLELVGKAHNGDFEARDKLILANQNLVIRIASGYDYQKSGLALDDLVQEGNFGLIQAVEKFDVTKGSRFEYYADKVIRQRILEALEENGRFVRLPHDEVTLLNKIKAYVNDYEQHNWEKPLVEEIAEHLDISHSEVKDIMNADSHIVELDAPLDIDDDESDTFISTLTMEDDVEADTYLIREDMKEWLLKVMKIILKERECYIFTHSIGFDCEECTVKDLAKELRLSGERIRQLKVGAMKKMKTAMLKYNMYTCANVA